MSKCGDCLYFGMCSHYIDAEETFPEIEGGCRVFKNKDAFVEVVRCKDCKRAENHGADHEIFCNLIGAYMGNDGFCSYGERRNGE